MPGPTACRTIRRTIGPNAHPKCANPACPVAFRWMSGGRFFRFRNARTGVRHFWLCEQCSHLFTLTHVEGRGVQLQLRPQLPQQCSKFTESDEGSTRTGLVTKKGMRH
jgi:hypothetical protein